MNAVELAASRSVDRDACRLAGALFDRHDAWAYGDGRAGDAAGRIIDIPVRQSGIQRLREWAARRRGAQQAAERAAGFLAALRARGISARWPPTAGPAAWSSMSGVAS